MTSPILVVDDDPVIRLLITEFLGAVGFTVEAVAGGVECLEKLSGGFEPSIIILDLQMPGLNGNETLAKLRDNKSTANIPVIMLSANVDNCTNDAALKANLYVEKPFQMKEFLAAVQSVLPS